MIFKYIHIKLSKTEKQEGIMRPANPEYILLALRTQIKRNGLTYPNLAKELDTPLSTLKRHLHNPNIALERLLTYCQAAKTSLEEVHDLAFELENSKLTLFSKTQDEIFIRYPELYDFYRELRFKSDNFEQLLEEYGLDELSVYPYLRSLEILGIINLQEGNKFIFKGQSFYNFHPDSALNKRIEESLKKQLINSDAPVSLGLSRIMISASELEEIESTIYKEILNKHNRNIKKGFTSKEYQKDIIFTHQPHKLATLSKDGIKPLPNSFLAEFKQSLSEIEASADHSDIRRSA